MLSLVAKTSIPQSERGWGWVCISFLYRVSALRTCTALSVLRCLYCMPALRVCASRPCFVFQPPHKPVRTEVSKCQHAPMGVAACREDFDTSVRTGLGLGLYFVFVPRGCTSYLYCVVCTACPCVSSVLRISVTPQTPFALRYRSASTRRWMLSRVAKTSIPQSERGLVCVSRLCSALVFCACVLRLGFALLFSASVLSHTTGTKNTVAKGGKFNRMDCARPWLACA